MDDKYIWMEPFQKDLFELFCREFGFKSLSDIGKFLGLKHPYHGAKLIFEAQKPNNYIKKMIELKSASNNEIKKLEYLVNEVENLCNAVSSSENNLSLSLDAAKKIKAFDL
jgi:hypothetical protein